MKLKFVIRAITLNILALLAFVSSLWATIWPMDFVRYLVLTEEDRLKPVGFFASLPGTELINGLFGFGILLALIVLGLLFFNLALLRKKRLYWSLSVLVFCLANFVFIWQTFSFVSYSVD